MLRSEVFSARWPPEALQKAGATGGLSFAVLASLPAINSASIALVAQLAGLRAALQVLLMIWLCGISLSYIADFANAEVVQEPTSAHAFLWKPFCVKDTPDFGKEELRQNYYT
jgi:uncharacterized membrane protein YraQ (UPF0718 family)